MQLLICNLQQLKRSNNNACVICYEDDEVVCDDMVQFMIPLNLRSYIFNPIPTPFIKAAETGNMDHMHILMMGTDFILIHMVEMGKVIWGILHY